VLLGEELSRDENWIRAITSYAKLAGPAASAGPTASLLRWPSPLRYLAQSFHPASRRTRMHAHEAGDIIAGVLKDRELQGERGEKVQHDDALEW
jgi:hypothetical protein